MPRPGNTTQRGYDWQHRLQRKKWEPLVNAGQVTCWRCGRIIIPDPTKRGDGWDLGHDDVDRRIYRGPEHAARCNRRAGARKGALIVNAKRRLKRTKMIVRSW